MGGEGRGGGGGALPIVLEKSTGSIDWCQSAAKEYVQGGEAPRKKWHFMHFRDLAFSTKNGPGSRGGPTIGGPLGKNVFLWEEGGPKH